MSTPTQNILIVEDDVQLRMLLSVILAQAGYNVRMAEDGFSALVEIRSETPDIILSDLYMHGMSGFELLSVVRRRFPAIRVIAMSSAFSGSDVPTGVAADAFYEKATKMSALLQTVEAMSYFNGLHSAYRPGTSTPVWIEALSGEPYVVIACPECLRTFAQVLNKVDVLIHETDCIYCHSLIPYAIIRRTDPIPSQVSQRIFSLGIPLPLRAPDRNYLVPQEETTWNDRGALGR